MIFPVTFKERKRLRLYQEYVQPFEGLISTSPSTSDEQIAPSESVSHSEVEADGDETIPAIKWEEVGIDDCLSHGQVLVNVSVKSPGFSRGMTGST